MRKRLRGALLSAATGLAAAAAPAGPAHAQMGGPPGAPGSLPPVGAEAPLGTYGPLPVGPMGGPMPGPAGGPGMGPYGPPPAGYPGGGPGSPAPGGVLPSSLRPNPRISPFDHRLNQTFHDGNLWMNESTNAGRKYSGGASYISGKFRRAPRTNIGTRRNLQEIFDETILPIFNNGVGNDADIGTDVTSDGFLYVKSQFIPTYDNGDLSVTGYEYFGLSLQRRVDPTTGFRINGLRLLPFYDDSVGLLDDGVTPDATTIESGDPGAEADAFTDAIGYAPITGDVFSGGNTDVLTGSFGPAINEQFEDADNPGIRGRFGFEDPDGSGFEISGDWLAEKPDRFNRGFSEDALLYSEFFDTSIDRPDLNYRTAPLGLILVDVNPDLLFGFTNGTPINRPPFAGGDVDLDGFADVGAFGLGPVDPTVGAFTYDLLFNHEFNSEQAGTEMSFIGSPILKRGRFRVRPSAGLRFNWLNERYRFDGLDSGAFEIFEEDLSYAEGADGGDVNDPTTGAPNFVFYQPGTVLVVDPSNGVGGEQNGGPDGTDEEGFYFPGVPPLTDPLPYQTRVSNEVQSYLFGPQIGLHYDVAGKFLTLRGHTKVGVAGLQERISVRGFGLNLNQHTTGDLMPFDVEETHTRLSPFIDTNIRGELNIFPYIPVLKRSKLLKNARFTGGFGVTSFAEISRPLDTMIWREANSGNPYINDDSDDRSKLYFTNWELGVNWRW